MQVKVHMLAFEPEYKVRMVTLPEEVRFLPNKVLDTVWHFGQNDFAFGPEKNTTCSVSVADVIELDNGSLHIVTNVGFKRITPEQLEELKAMNQRDRSFCHILG